ncbi:MAG TPA: hypothetical protein VHX13_06455 [Acidobacteriaceae bacterium]|nr:hypothetical protein [Acidobacteriaceae bacterium]
MATVGCSSDFVIGILILLVAALATLLVGGAPPVVLMACICGASLGVWLLYQMNSGRRQVKLTEILAAALLIGYCGGCAITQSLSGLDQSGVTFAGWNTVPASWAAYTITNVLLASALLLLAGSAEPALIRDGEIIRVGRQEEWLIWIGMGIVILEIFLGQFGYQGTTAEEGTSRVSFFGELSASLLLLMLPLSAVGWVQSSGIRRFRFGFTALISLILIVPVGRRSLVYCLLVAVFAAMRLSGVQISVGRLTRWVWSALAIVVIFTLTVLFLSLRIAVDNLGPGNHPMAQIVPQIDVALQNPEFLLRTTKENLESRPFLLTQYLSLLTKGGNAPEPMYGSDLKFSIEEAVPDVLYGLLGRSKNRVRAIGAEEGLANEQFHLPVFDDANSILTSGFIDLGVFGLALYPIGICLLWRILLVDVRIVLGKKARLLLLLIALNTFMQAELALSGYLVEIRNGLIILALWICLRSIPSLRLRHRNRDHLRGYQPMSNSAEPLRIRPPYESSGV